MYTYREAANFATFVLYAAKMNEQYYNNPTPPADPRIEESGWKVIAYISADDLSFSVTPRKGELPEHVCYGYVAKKVAEKNHSSGEYIIAIRGTDPTILLEDVHDGLIDFTSPWTRFPKIAVSQGFFSVYDSMKLIPIEPESHRVYSNLKLAEAIARLIGVNGQFTIAGHSLGAAIASYLMYEIGSIAPNHSACLFACPRPGNREFAKLVTQNFSNFAVFNYIDDVIPHLPPKVLGYASLDYINAFKPQTNLAISDGPLCSHYLINYIARLDLEVCRRATKQGDIDSCINL
ncbi:lipase family protein [Xenorhabdus sp. SF857]|uniref:lipase family protein n=1 Tax=Xenorhabdus bakwenae TaxID=3026967 RepID=UPI002557FF5F|nr:lipase family protein [Xenorhabdus sp. SF857]WFQ78325.1 lipase family protein [Xenorhabdus sp. SF857]